MEIVVRKNQIEWPNYWERRGCTDSALSSLVRRGL